MSFGIGQPVPRVEDPQLVTGAGRFTDDIDLPGQLYAARADRRLARASGPHCGRWLLAGRQVRARSAITL